MPATSSKQSQPLRVPAALREGLAIIAGKYEDSTAQKSVPASGVMMQDDRKLFCRPPNHRWLLALALLLVAFWAGLLLLGRHFISDSGLGVWTGAATPDTSQWIADPYTFTHLLHGILFYWLLLPLRRRVTVEWRFFIAALIEALWEVLENTSYVIERYRTATVSLDYYGDSILNSTFDLIFAMFGFWLAAKWNWKWVIALFLAVELLLAYFVRDNLTLNILTLLFPLDAIKQWQLGHGP